MQHDIFYKQKEQRQCEGVSFEWLGACEKSKEKADKTEWRQNQKKKLIKLNKDKRQFNWVGTLSFEWLGECEKSKGKADKKIRIKDNGMVWGQVENQMKKLI